MAGTFISNIGSVDFALPPSAPVIAAAPQYGRDILKIIGDSLNLWLWAEGGVLAASPLKMIDAANGREVTALAAGAAIATGAFLGGKPYFNMPGGVGFQFRANYQIPPSYSLVTVLRTPASMSGVPIFGSNLGVGVRHRLFAAAYEYIHGSGGGAPSNVVGTSPIPVSSDVLLWTSYNAPDQTLRIGVNSLDAKVTANVVSPVPVAAQTDFGGQALSGSFAGPLAEQQVVNKALHGSTQADTLRRALLARMAANYGITLT